MSTSTSTRCRPAPMNPANAHWQARRRRLMAYGQWQPFMDAEPVREHLRKVMAEGMPLGAICERLGLPHTSSLQHLLYGRGPYGPGHQVRRETAEMILSYWPTLADFPDGSRIDSTGTRRRVQALAVRGWPRHWMAEQVGMSASPFNKAVHKARVTARLARAVAALYDEWWNRDPLEYKLPPKSVDRVKADAARAGWYGPLAWDDDTIDDPSAMPQTDSIEPVATEGENLADRWILGEAVVLTPEARKEVLAYLFEWTNDTTEEIAARLGLTPEAADQQWYRLVRKARQEGRRLWRRVYVKRERTMNQNEMEEAA
ncbi:sigma-70 RNA polymerase sigma factor region 4 domain-containing protein [Streptomyces olivaceoviridis]|uniref:hypothetical protein n=1 Tax=Streptomyces olivaceoviridis TaxID=1921 RepID=UPI0036C42167